MADTVRAIPEDVPRTTFVSIGLAIVVLVGAVVLSYVVVRRLRVGSAGGAAVAIAGTAAASAAVVPYQSGDYLIAFVFVASECGVCQDPAVRTILRQVRASLQRYTPEPFRRITVVGVAIDADVTKGMAYIESLGPIPDVFDELSLGSGWLNEQVLRYAWGDGFAKPAVPQVVLVWRSVDASGYPEVIDVAQDAFVYRAVGRDSLLEWHAAGTPLPSSRLPLRVTIE